MIWTRHLYICDIALLIAEIINGCKESNEVLSQERSDSNVLWRI